MTHLDLRCVRCGRDGHLSKDCKQPIFGLDAKRQRAIDEFYTKHGPCCAGCDWWRWFNSVVGECIRSAPVAGAERAAMLGISGASIDAGAGHVMTCRDHCCGEFHDSGVVTA